MKNFTEFFKEIVQSEELKQAYEKAVNGGAEAVEAFMKEHDCEATMEDVFNFFKELNGDQPLSEEEMEKIAGGNIVVPRETGIFPWNCSPTYSCMGEDRIPPQNICI